MWRSSTQTPIWDYSFGIRHPVCLSMSIRQRTSTSALDSTSCRYGARPIKSAGARSLSDRHRQANGMSNSKGIIPNRCLRRATPHPSPWISTKNKISTRRLDFGQFQRRKMMIQKDQVQVQVFNWHFWGRLKVLESTCISMVHSRWRWL